MSAADLSQGENTNTSPQAPPTSNTELERILTEIFGWIKLDDGRWIDDYKDDSTDDAQKFITEVRAWTLAAIEDLIQQTQYDYGKTEQYSGRKIIEPAALRQAAREKYGS